MCFYSTCPDNDILLALTSQALLFLSQFPQRSITYRCSQKTYSPLDTFPSRFILTTFLPHLINISIFFSPPGSSRLVSRLWQFVPFKIPNLDPNGTAYLSPALFKNTRKTSDARVTNHITSSNLDEPFLIRF